MPSLNIYNKLNGYHTNGQIHKINSDKIIDATWWNDISSQVVYLYDYYHDKNLTQLNDLDPKNDINKIPIDAKFLQYSSQTYAKDTITFHLQLRPGQECNVPYYKEFFSDRYNATFPVGLMVDICDESGKYNKWMVVDKANYNGNQFPTFELLRCDYVLRYVIDNVKYTVPCVLRSQNS